MSDVRVPGWGRKDSRLVLIGECPGESEERKGEPFVGASGHRLAEWWQRCGLTRHMFRIENVCEYRPPNNDASLWDRETWLTWMDDLHARLAELEDPWLIVPTGNYALYALTGKGNVPWHTREGKDARPGILSWRGSILSYEDRKGRIIKVIPTPHPAATFPGRNPALEPVCIRDWARIAVESKTREINTPERTHNINPSIEQIETFIREFDPETEYLSIDIENPPVDGKYPIVIVGFSKTPLESLVITTTKAVWGDKLDEVWELIRQLCELPPYCKIACNGFHEQFWLWHERAIRFEWDWDILYMHHALDPSAPKHSLDFCASLDTREPYWKAEAKDPDEQRKYTSNMTAFAIYNGKDNCVQRELFDVYYHRLVRDRRWTPTGEMDGLDFYLQHYARLFDGLVDVGRTGLRVDDATRAQRFKDITAKVAEIKAAVNTHAGVDIYGKKAISNKKLQAYLYETLKLPVQTKRRKGKGEATVTADEVAVRKLMFRFPDRLGITGPCILDARRQAKLCEYYEPTRLDADGRFRSAYSLNTEAGRLNAKTTPLDTGGNAQNIDREARDMFLADEGCVGVEVDLSQAEARICYLKIYELTGDETMLERARLRPDEYDQHTEMAAMLFNTMKDNVSKLQRYLGKTTVHGAQRDMHGKTLSERFLKDGYVVSPEECSDYIEKYHKLVPGLQEYFRWTRTCMIRDKCVVNSWGRRMWCRDDRMSDELYRQFYSFLMQSEVADLMNQQGFYPLWKQLKGQSFNKINAHSHDALFCSLLPHQAYAITKGLVDSLEAPHKYGDKGIELIMPCEVKLGRNWKGSREWKRMPSREEFNAAVNDVMR